MTHPSPRVLLVVLLASAIHSQAFASTVGLLGSDTMKMLVTRLDAVAPGTVRFVQGIDSVRGAKPGIVLLVINAPDGPMPVHDDALRLMSEARVKRFAIVFTGTKEIHDPELFELIIGEVLDKVSAAGLTSGAPVFLDSDSVRVDPALRTRNGVKALQEYIHSL